MANPPALVTQVRGLGLPDRAVRAIEEIQAAVRSGQFALTGDALSQVQRLVAQGAGGSGSGGDAGTVNETPDLSPPPALENLTADGGYGIVFLRWDPARDRRYGYAEIWRSSTNNIGTAVMVATAAGNLYPDEVQDQSTFYYWVRAVNKWDTSVKSAYTPNGTTGVAATTAPDVDYLLEALAGAISQSQLAGALSSRIDLIDAGSGTPGSVNARIVAETNARTAGDTALATSISALAVSSDPGFDWAKIWYFDTTVEGWTSNGGSPTVSAGGYLRPANSGSDPQLISPAGLAISAATYAQVKVRVQRVGTPTWEGRLYWKRTGDATWDIGRSVTAAEPTWTGGLGAVVFAPTWNGTIDQIRLDLGAAADNTNRHELDWAAVGRSAPGASTAMVADLEQTKIGYCVIGGVATDQTSKAACELAGGTWSVGLPIATAVRQVAVNDGGGSVALEQRFVAQRTTNQGLLGQYTVKIDANGRVAGFGLASTVSAAGVGTSDFAIRADRFYIAPPGGVDFGIAPFTVLTSPTVINGDTVPAGTYIADAFIRNAAITGAKIATATITDANIASLDAFKITVDSLVGRMAQITTGEFQQIFATKAVITDANIVDGTITTAKIANVIRSTNFNGFTNSTSITDFGTAGWAIAKNGQAVFNDVAVRGTVISPCPGGDVELGRDVGPGGGHYGLSLSATNFNNIFLRRSDGHVFFRVNAGGASSIDYSSEPGGGLTIKGTVTASDINASLIRNTDFSAYLDVRPGAPSGYLLYTVNAKILADGSTRFANEIATGVQGFGLFMSEDGVGAWSVAADISIPGAIGLQSAAFTVLCSPSVTVQTSGIPVTSFVGETRTEVELAVSQTIGSTGNATAASNAGSGVLAIRARVNFKAAPAYANYPFSPVLNSIQWRVIRVT